MKDRGDGVFVEDPVHEFFGLTYSAYFVVPRVALEAMPLSWQERFVSLMREAEDAGLQTPTYKVLRTDSKGRFAKDPWREYRRPGKDITEQLAEVRKRMEAV